MTVTSADPSSPTNAAIDLPPRQAVEARRPFGSFRLNHWQGDLFAIAATAATLGLRLALTDQLRDRPTLVAFMVPIILSAYVGGLRVGLLATALSYIGASYYLLPPFHDFHVQYLVDRWDLFFLVLAGTAVSVLNDALHRARRRADIAGRKLVEEAKQASEARYRTLFEHAPNGIVIADAQSYYLDANPSICRMLGYSRDELIGLHASDIVAPTEIPRIGEAIGVIHSRSTYEREWQFRRKDGSIVSADVAATMMPDGNLMAAIRDITERKRAEDTLRKSETQLQAIVENISEAVVVSDLTGKLLHFNPPALEMLGYSNADEGRRGFSELVDTFELSGVDGTNWTVDQWPLARILRGETLHNLEARMRRIGTEWNRIFSFGGTLAHDANGKPLMAIVTFDDVTARKQGEDSHGRAMEEARSINNELSFYKFALDEASIVAVTDAAGTIGYVNDKFCNISGYSREELIGNNHRLLNSRHHPKSFFVAMYAAIARGKVWRGEIRNRAKDGHHYWVDTTIVPMQDTNGRVTQYVAIRADITARKQAEEARCLLDAELKEAKEAAEAANRAKSEFLANMSHELRTPMNCIIGFAEFLVDGKTGEVNPKQKEYLGDILSSGRHLLQLINDVLDLAKVEAGKMQLHLETFGLRQAIEDVCAVAKSMAQKKRIKVKLEIAAGLDCVTLDQQKLKQAIYNLLSNAIKFTDEGGTVDIHGSKLNGSGFSLAVRDTGIGIRPEDIKRLFREFEQLESGAARPQEGTGLGLVLTRKIMELQGGTIAIESTFGKGSVFTLTLPLIAREVRT